MLFRISKADKPKLDKKRKRSSSIDSRSDKVKKINVEKIVNELVDSKLEKLERSFATQSQQVCDATPSHIDLSSVTDAPVIEESISVDDQNDSAFQIDKLIRLNQSSFEDSTSNNFVSPIDNIPKKSSKSKRRRKPKLHPQDVVENESIIYINKIGDEKVRKDLDFDSLNRVDFDNLMVRAPYFYCGCISLNFYFQIGSSIAYKTYEISSQWTPEVGPWRVCIECSCYISLTYCG